MPGSTHIPGQAPIAVTMGEPAGIGGEIALIAWKGRTQDTPAYFVIDAPDRLQSISTKLDMGVRVIEISRPDETADAFREGLPVLPVGYSVSTHPGHPSTESAAAVCASIEHAVQFCLDKTARGMTTSPIQKNTLYDAGFAYPGHTEYVAHLSGNHEPVMMLASPMLRVVPVTMHEQLSKAIDSLSTATIISKARITARALQQDFGIETPRLAMAGLNPHAGEDGNLGHEENDIILPAIETLRNDGLHVDGPVPPDALFMPRMRDTYDAAICQYHDQALIPIKALDVDNAVNVTIGLPIIRTSPDHGTALNIAGTGTANPQSFIAALRMADQLAYTRSMDQATRND
ncbi:MAG: 4-hydroxythreonine-4-phosphate dehydrogenase PdxA [Rhodospirillales bacterium]|jgi:4-hydroxythreonine-4-phosphate dehydrogenase|nr:4-hydroxythreonine-4-phosphate dehydrogenase PdxA [Rhodospirillales bacterium]MBT4041234.1 4-hydroxythreonine-4-phosphate dehydrogenase PdxA [Rhodospirillales bacterium]MBT4628066.1 4-hydroxythreonine-4-phosphate dehydrogenase PdxA [Rhodospirillales bacterium]MBT5353391.1 4-hydroxythreonine-4-phosphate dehydrogenase PdxA [Rhodospirillales bacterium]MBT5521118.1 4-hydroxythreonine-4-phosphate dehydrogenase PdxA [Rhodospirillales bacterium]